MNVDTSYVHALEGRLRIKIPRVKGAARQAQEVERHLRQSAGIEDVSANPTTGNVLILYNSRLIDQEDIISSLKEVGYLSHPSHRGSGGNNPAFSPARGGGKGDFHRGRHLDGIRPEPVGQRPDLRRRRQEGDQCGILSA